MDLRYPSNVIEKFARARNYNGHGPPFGG
jgi:hypothetical protein